MNWRGLLLLGLLIAAAAGSWLLERFTADSAAVLDRPQTIDPGYFLADATITQLDANGAVLYELEAERIIEDGSLSEVQLRNVRVQYRFENANWAVQAARGAIDEAGRLIHLNGDVRATGSGPTAGTAVIRTEALLLDTEARLVSTSEPVRVELGRYAVTTVGLKAYLKENRLELQSEVHGRFTP